MSRQIKQDQKISLSAGQAAARVGGKLLFTAYHGQKAALLIRDDRLQAASFFPKEQSKIGAIYICKVKNAVHHLSSYFVEIGTEREICFLPAKEAAHPFLLNRKYDGRILEGDEFPVQITRDASKEKQASVTTRISLANSYFVLHFGESGIGYSDKLSSSHRAQIEQLLEARRDVVQSAGLVVRTRAAELLAPEPSDNALFYDTLNELRQQFEAIFRTATHRTCFSCLREAPSFWEAAVEHLVYPHEYEEILTDDRKLYEELQAVSGGKPIRFYSEQESRELPLTKLYGLESKLGEALAKKVWLKCGGYLVIEPTEALTVIDVNSGKYESKKESEDTYFSINREAAQEIARQLRLRNLSGMIVVDFINMRSRERQNELLAYLKELVKKDKQKTVVVDMTPLGLVEITRKKSSKTLAEQLA